MSNDLASLDALFTSAFVISLVVGAFIGSLAVIFAAIRGGLF